MEIEELREIEEREREIKEREKVHRLLDELIVSGKELGTIDEMWIDENLLTHRKRIQITYNKYEQSQL